MTETSIVTSKTTTSKDGTTIGYTKLGSGPSVVLVDGAMCYREFGPMKSLADALSKDFSVYYYDRRGRGESGDTAPYAVEREIEDLAAIVAEAEAPVFAVGESSGAALIMRAVEAGVPIARIVGYEPPYVNALKQPGAPTPDYEANLKALVQKGDRGGAVKYFMVDMVGAPAFVPLMMKTIARKPWAQLKSIAHTISNDAAVMQGFVVPADDLAKISVPTLVMVGGKAKPNMAEAVKQVAAAIPGAVHRVLPGQTHQVATKVIAPEIAAFFR